MSNTIPNIPDDVLDALVEQAAANVAKRARKPANVAKAVQSEYAKLVQAVAKEGNVAAFQSDRATATERRKLSVHETGHALVAAHLGVKVQSVAVDRDGGGVTKLDNTADAVVELEITVAGYVAVALEAGMVPTVTGFKADSTNFFDVDDAEMLVDTEDLGQLAIARAIKAASAYLSQDAVRADLQTKARELNKVRRLVGGLFN